MTDRQRAKCFECGNEATHSHHVVPRSLGGSRTVLLCSCCHPKAHGKRGFWKTGELTKAALSRKKSKGERTGGTVPFGFELVDDVKLLPKPEEFEILKLMHSLRKQGLTLREIVGVLTEKGIPTKTGRAGWQPKVVMRILDRTANLICQLDAENRNKKRRGGGS